MSQEVFADIDPEVTTGLMLATLLDDFKDAIMSGFSGTSRPLQLEAGGYWVDTTDQDAPNYTWSMKIFTGTVDYEILRINIVSGVSGFNTADGLFSVRKISADAVGPILNLVKQRVADSGQVLLGDTVARIEMIGRTDTPTNPLVAYIKVTASEDYQTGTTGASLSMYSTSVGSSSLTEYLSFLEGCVESVVGHKFNAIIYGQDTVASTTDLVVSSDSLVSEITGTVAATIHGVEVTDAETKFKVLINATDKTIFIEHESLDADPEERIKLPLGANLRLLVGGSVTLWYCEADSRWKYFSGAVESFLAGMDTFRDGYYEWVAPLTGRVIVNAYKDKSLPVMVGASSFGSNDTEEYLFTWGRNDFGQLGVGDTTPRSSPVVVLGVKFVDHEVNARTSYGLTEEGILYAWGRNTSGQLGSGDVTDRSSPVAVVGGLRFSRAQVRVSSYAFQQDGTLYAWGNNVNGQLGLGDVTHRSSPVQVLGGLKFADLFNGLDSEPRVFGVDRATGNLYAWGLNNSGSLGVGDTTSRSSPVAVLGGIKFSKIVFGTDCTLGMSTDGTLYAWGLNDVGQLGVGDVASRSSPVAVLGGFTAIDIYSYGKSFLAKLQDNTLIAWGENGSGQLGLGDTTSRSSPVAVVGALEFDEVIFNYGTVLASTYGVGDLYSWGANGQGQLGVGDITNRSSPVAVLGGLKFTKVYVGDGSCYGLATDGVFYAWGSNGTYGQLGVGDLTNRSSPVAVVGGAILGEKYYPPTTTTFEVEEGETYPLILGGGNCRFGTGTIGVNVRKATITYEG